MEFIRKLLTQIGGLWGKWSMIQRIILAGIVLVVLVGIGALVTVSSSATLVPVIDAPIRDEAARDRIITRINQEGLRATVNAAGVIQVHDEKTAQRMRGILSRLLFSEKSLQYGARTR